MERIVHVFLVHRVDQQAHRLHHDHRIARLDGDDDIVEMLAFADAQELHTAFDDALGRVAVAVAYAVGERAVVDADADGGVVRLADVEEGHEAVVNLLQFVGVFGVGVLVFDEASGRVDVVAGVDAYLLGIECGDVGHVGVEVDVGHERCVEAVGAYARIDVLQVLGLALALRGEAHELTAGLDDALGLRYAGLSVVGVGGGHRLDADGVVAAHVECADVHHRRLPPVIVKQIHGSALEFIVLNLSEFLVGLLNLLSEAGLPCVDLLGDGLIAECYHLSGEDGGVLRTIDAHRSHGDARRHLDDGEHGIEAVEHALDGYADDRQWGRGGDDTGQGGSHASTRDDDLHAAGLGTFGKLLHSVGRAMG